MGKMGQSISFPHEIDLHFHAGSERIAPLQEYIQWSTKRGRKILGIVDHFEYYVTNKYTPPQGMKGFERFLDEVEESKKSGIEIFQGMEIELETLVSAAQLLKPFFTKIKYLLIEGHFTSIWDYLVVVKEAQKVSNEYGISVVVAHPLFPDRIEKNFEYLNSGLSFEAFRQKTERELPEGIVTILSEREIERLIALFFNSGVYFELNMRRLTYGNNQRVRDYQIQRAAHIYRSLREGGVQFSLGSDIHKLNIDGYCPDEFCSQAHIGVKNLGIVERLQLL